MSRLLSFLITLLLGLLAVKGDFYAVLTPTLSGAGASGFAHFTLSGENITVSVELDGLVPNSTHGLHIHAWGDISSQDGNAAGGHFNPYGVSHSCGEPRHVGDLGNIIANEIGHAEATFTVFNASFSPASPGFILGRGVILHANPDDCATQPTGNAGGRLLQGVVGLNQGSTLDFGSGTSNNVSVARAVAVVKKTTLSQTNVTGTISFVTEGSGVRATLYISGLERSSTHSFHINQYGDISDGDGSSTGDHFNPGGELECFTFTANPNGLVYSSYLFNNYSLVPDQPNSIIGRAFVIQAGDDCTSSTDSDIIAMGVIGITTAKVTTPSALAVLEPTIGNQGNGTVEFTYVNNGGVAGLNVRVRLTGLNASTIHGLHIHQYGDITNGNGSATGAHWNPKNASHGCSGERHVGDIGNVYANDAGVVETDIFTELAGLDPNSANAFIIGRSVILHADEDGCQSNSVLGAKIMQGVIGYKSGSISIIGTSSSPNVTVQAVCSLKGTGNNTISGNVTFVPRTTGGTYLYFYVKGLQPNSIHGIHIHEFGDITSATGAAAGSHFNPTNSSHGCPASANHHAGDNGNFQATAGGEILALHLNYDASLNAAHNNSIFGRALIIHANPDNCIDIASSGSRIAQCVIGYTASAPRSDPTPPGPPPSPSPSPSPASLKAPSLALLFLALAFAFLF